VTTTYPLPPGHEIAGTVAEVGSEVPVRGRRPGRRRLLRRLLPGVRELPGRGGSVLPPRRDADLQLTPLPDGSVTQGGHAEQMEDGLRLGAAHYRATSDPETPPSSRPGSST
jgi:NADPH:quinone reductase-like Zn-dependent oxidoreductase